MHSRLALTTRARVAWSVIALGLLATAPCAAAVHCWQDPVITHTNGMRLASTTWQRSHNVYWRPDPGHIGYCDGRMYGPCKNELRELGRRSECYPLPVGPAPGAVRSMTHHAHEGLEQASGERLGTVRLDAGVLGSPLPAGASAQASPTVPAGADWIGTLQTLGDKVIGGQTPVAAP